MYNSFDQSVFKMSLIPTLCESYSIGYVCCCLSLLSFYKQSVYLHEIIVGKTAYFYSVVYFMQWLVNPVHCFIFKSVPWAARPWHIELKAKLEQYIFCSVAASPSKFLVFCNLCLRVSMFFFCVYVSFCLGWYCNCKK